MGFRMKTFFRHITVPKRKFLRKDNGENAPRSLSLYLGSAIYNLKRPPQQQKPPRCRDSLLIFFFPYDPGIPPPESRKLTRTPFVIPPPTSFRGTALAVNPEPSWPIRLRPSAIRFPAPTASPSAKPSGSRICACLPHGGIQACPGRR
jgi:hypothetical protein